MVKGETLDIIIFCFPWFSSVWFYALKLEFPTDCMRPGFFIGIYHNVGDVFTYELLDVASYHDIPTHGRLHTVIHSVVRKLELANIDALTIHY